MQLSDSQIEYIKSRGLTVQEVESQVNLFKRGPKRIELVRPARIMDGIRRLKIGEIKAYDKEYSEIVADKKITKFVPASGAATRMFKDLYTYLETKKITDTVEQFVDNLEKFAFYQDLKNVLKDNNLDIDELINSQSYDTIIDYLLSEKGLSYGQLPKGLLAFHKNGEKARTPIDEHIAEAMAYAGSHPNLVFTVSEEFEEGFKEEIENSKKEQNSEALSYGLSFQKPETDTVAVTKDFQLVKPNEKTILFRPGGHGSLIENLNDIDADIIFVKNIDNVCSAKDFTETVKYKKALASILTEIQAKIFDYSKKVENYDGKDEAFNFELRSFFEQELGIFLMELCRMDDYQKAAYFKEKLNRPIRVCGMVRNEGEPGGGPFWVRDASGAIYLQIIESSQIDHSDEDQKLIFSESSHFNPVDIVCSVKNVDGKKYDLKRFVDKNAFFIAEKSYQGEEVLALEHPGLWNGGMGDWNTIFVEVFDKTFNPVKTVNDLLRNEHQN